MMYAFDNFAVGVALICAYHDAWVAAWNVQIYVQNSLKDCNSVSDSQRHIFQRDVDFHFIEFTILEPLRLPQAAWDDPKAPGTKYDVFRCLMDCFQFLENQLN